MHLVKQKKNLNKMNNIILNDSSSFELKAKADFVDEWWKDGIIDGIYRRWYSNIYKLKSSFSFTIFKI